MSDKKYHKTTRRDKDRTEEEYQLEGTKPFHSGDRWKCGNEDCKHPRSLHVFFRGRCLVIGCKCKGFEGD